MPTHCPRGHAYDEGNTYINPRGVKICRACGRMHAAKYKPPKRPGYSSWSVTQRFFSVLNRRGPVPEHRPDLGPCWLREASLDNHGYAVFNFTSENGKRKSKAHQFGYELVWGPIPDGYEPDHLCRVKACCRPSHLESVTHRENMLRGNTIAAKFAAKTHCPQGHPYDEANTYRTSKGYRQCIACRPIYRKRAG